MAKTKVKDDCCSGSTVNSSCCKVESVTSIDDRGQMVLPKEIRDKANIRPGDKLAVISMEKDGAVCCISLIKVDKLEDIVKGMLGPVMKDILEKK